MDAGRRWLLLQVAVLAASCAPQTVVINDVADSGPPDAAVAPDAPADATAQADTSSPATEVGCATKTVLTYMQQPAQVLIEMDRSSNMQEAFSPTTRAGEVQTALSNEIANYQQHVQFGYEQFPSSGSDAPCASGTCCAGNITVPPTAINKFPDINSSMNCYFDAHGGNCMSTSADSPSHAALAMASDYFSRGPRQFDGDQYVLLFTASEPSCAGQDASTACTAASKATSDLHNDGVRVHVFYVGDPPDPSGCITHLNATTTILHVATSSNDLSSVIQQIVHQAASAACTLFSYQTPPADANKVQISLGPNSSVPPDGWTPGYTRNVITLLGSSCETFLNSKMEKLSVTFSNCRD
jgi:hypothetical protein